VVSLKVAPPAGVIIRFEQRPGTVAWYLVNDKGRALAGRPVEVAVSGEPRVLPQVSAKEPTPVPVRGQAPVTVSVRDMETGNTGVVEVRP
jgi:hypothetical protein